MGHRSLSDVALIAHVEQALDMPSAYSGSFGREERLGLNLSANSVTKYCQAITGQLFFPTAVIAKPLLREASTDEG
jgi:hypothetical protein